VLWREFVRFPDPRRAGRCTYIFFAAQTLRRFVKEAIDSPRRFLEKRVVLQRFTRDLAQESGRPVEQLPADTEGAPVVCPTAGRLCSVILLIIHLYHLIQACSR
jgi:hypothetical protein